MGKRKYYLVLDTETANGLQQPLCYDVGFAICDSRGNIYEQRSYIVEDIFIAENDNFHNRELMSTCHYAKKIPQYLRDYMHNTIQTLDILSITNEIKYLADLYEVTAICAYNIMFDVRALNNTLRLSTCSKHRYALPYGVPLYDIWHMACQSVLNSKTYFKQALRNKWYNEKTNNLKTNAECTYRYLTSQNEFEENHTGLEDVKIEIFILVKCLKRGNKIDRSVKFNCWQIPQARWKKYYYDRYC